jgi:hypothetical protein
LRHRRPTVDCCDPVNRIDIVGGREEDGKKHFVLAEVLAEGLSTAVSSRVSTSSESVTSILDIIR